MALVSAWAGVGVRGVASGGAVARAAGSAERKIDNENRSAEVDARACCNDCRDEGVQCHSVAQCQCPVCPLPENW